MTPEQISEDPITPTPTETPELQPLEIDGINWVTSIFLISTFVVAAISTPLYIWKLGIGFFEVALFFSFFYICGLSITVGYHRCVSHRAFNASWPVRLFISLFGAAAFQSSALWWASDHRYHHKFVDREGDPHDPHSIQRGFFWAHMGWMLVYVKPALRMENIADLEKDPILRWQHKYLLPISIGIGFFLPMAIGAAWSGLSGRPSWHGILAGFLFGGCTRIVVLHHITFLINSLAHTVGFRPFDGEASSRDSTLVAMLTFGEGYHNFHHAFQTDYRNGTSAWHFDPGKWVIWSLGKVGLASDLRKVPRETLRLARIKEKKRRLEARLESGHVEVSQHVADLLSQVEERLDRVHLQLRTKLSQLSQARQRRRQEPELFTKVKADLAQAKSEFKSAVREWHRIHRQVLA